MSDHLRLSSPLSSSPGRIPAISRPEWPWSARSYTHRNSQSSVHSSGSVVGSSNLQSGWDARSAFASGGSPSLSSVSTSLRSGNMFRTGSSATGIVQPEELTRQWSFMGFEWVVRDVHKLRDYIEGTDPIDPEATETDIPDIEQTNFDILKQSPVLGDNKFKLEIVITTSDSSSTPSTLPALSLYITSLMVDFAHGNYETSASMMAAIKCQDDRAGERGARPNWVWEYWQHDWVFRQESEVWACPLPSLSSLLNNSRIRETDSFVICIQIHSPAGPSVPQQPSVYYVPRDLLEGLEASLDNSNTGDVRFVCLEKLMAAASPVLPSSDAAYDRQSISSQSSQSPFSSQTTARKRIIYAHSDILTRRSDYFATMFSSAFSENSGLAGDRKFYTVIVEEADFETIYWLLKYCYANWLLFKDIDDPKAAVDGVGVGWSAKWLNASDGEWDWKTFPKCDPGDDYTLDNRSAASGDSLPANSTIGGTSTTSINKAPTVPGARTSSTKHNITASTSKSTTAATRRSAPLPVPSSLTVSVNRDDLNSRSKPISIGGSSNRSPTAPYSVSPRATRQSVHAPDPHLHPTPAPPPASALSMYQVAHRYAMPTLANLALEHMMATITPQSSFALLLATSVWNDLHTIVQDYVIDKWDDVSASEEFEQCCQEVAAGEWGPDGGKALTAVFRRLRSPNAIAG
ncbi:hypothetical protein BDQ17DRAFT_1351883 [Cyathus striatus]|nr:hypothetical protein BDQ17DRAFT_1351883 [Cyathus striatus]